MKNLDFIKTKEATKILNVDPRTLRNSEITDSKTKQIYAVLSGIRIHVFKHGGPGSSPRMYSRREVERAAAIIKDMISTQKAATLLSVDPRTLVKHEEFDEKNNETFAIIFGFKIKVFKFNNLGNTTRKYSKKDVENAASMIKSFGTQD